MESKQLEFWILAALAAPLAHFSGCGWLTVLLAAAALLPLSLLPKRWEFSGPAAFAQILWLGIVAGVLLSSGADYWPSGSKTAVPLTILTLGALTKRRSAPAVGAVLAICMGLLALPTALAGVAQLRFELLSPHIGELQPGLILALLLVNLPIAPGKGRIAAAIGSLALILAVLVQGIVSMEVASAVKDPFYRMARTLGHMEPIAASGMTMGWYALASAIYGSAVQIGKNSGLGERLSYVLVWGTATGWLLFEWQLSAPFLMGFSAFLWVLSPFFQKLKKVKNSA